MITLDVPQLSNEWFAARAGIPTASCFDKIITSDGKPSKQAEKYLFQLAGEAITGKKADGYSNAIIERGVEMEPEARGLYELINDVEVQEVGLCYPDEQKKYSYSPDGLIGEDGQIEIKCPIISTHVEYLLKDKLPAAYHRQVQGGLLITGREWCDFVSYHPGIKPFIFRVERDKEFLKKLEAELDKFCYVLAATIQELKAK